MSDKDKSDEILETKGALPPEVDPRIRNKLEGAATPRAESINPQRAIEVIEDYFGELDALLKIRAALDKTIDDTKAEKIYAEIGVAFGLDGLRKLAEQSGAGLEDYNKVAYAATRTGAVKLGDVPDYE